MFPLVLIRSANNEVRRLGRFSVAVNGAANNQTDPPSGETRQRLEPILDFACRSFPHQASASYSFCAGPLSKAACGLSSVEQLPDRWSRSDLPINPLLRFLLYIPLRPTRGFPFVAGATQFNR